MRQGVPERCIKRSRSPENSNRDRHYGHDRRRPQQQTNEGKQENWGRQDWHEGGEKRGRFNREYEGFERRNEPTNVIMLRGLNSITTQEKLTDVLKSFGPVMDVRLIRNKATGESRCFAFVDFATAEEAAAFMEYSGGLLELDERSVQMDFSRQKDHPPGEFKDWLCPQCSGSNFARRSACYLCQAPKPANPVPANVLEENRDAPCSVLVARGLNSNTTEETLYSVFSAFAPVKEVRLIRDKHSNLSRGFSFIEYSTPEEAAFALQNSTHLCVDEHMLRISYARKNWDRNTPQPDQEGFYNPNGPQVVANVALEQAQWAIQQRKMANAPPGLPNMAAPSSFPAAVPGNGQLETADPSQGKGPGAGYVLDESSGYYYNTLTGLYYDPNSGYYYNPMTQQYMLQDSSTPATTTTAPISNTDNAITTSATDGPEIKLIMNEKVEKLKTPLSLQDKEKKKKQKTIKDKKLSAEMQRWSAKKKELLEEPAEAPSRKIKFSLGSVIGTPTTAAHAFNASSIEEKAPSPQEGTTKAEELPVQIVAASSEETATTAPIAAPEVTATSIAERDILPPLCLLCRRQFETTEQLDTHKQLSKLHKSNHEAVKARLVVHRMREVTKQQNKAKAVPLTGYSKKKKKKKGMDYIPSSSGIGASISMPSPAENKGSQLLRKMGWKDGEGLGKTASGITAPIDVVIRSERAGIGSESLEYSVESGDSYQQATKKKARARLENLMKRY